MGIHGKECPIGEFFTHDNVSISMAVRLIHEHHDPPARFDTLCITAEDTAADGIQPDSKSHKMCSLGPCMTHAVPVHHNCSSAYSPQQIPSAEPAFGRAHRITVERDTIMADAPTSVSLACNNNNNNHPSSIASSEKRVSR